MVAALIIFTVALAICANASYNVSESVMLDNGTSVNLYDENGNALVWYYDGSTLKSKTLSESLTVDKDGKITLKDISVSSVVVLNLQDKSFSTTFDVVPKIFNFTFEKSEKIEYIYLADEVESFGVWYTFAKCTKLKVCDISVNSNLKSFGQYAFHNSTALKELHIPALVEALPGSNNSEVGLVSGCKALEKVTFGDMETITSVPTGTFYGTTGLKEIILPNSVTYIGGGAFRNSGIVNSPFTKDSRCTTFGQYCFRNCDSLKNIIIPATLTTIEAPNYPEYGPFAECDEIEFVTFGTATVMTRIPAHLFSKSNIKNITIPEGIVTIGRRAFYNCISLTEVKLPNSLISAEERVFEGCKNLKKIVFGASFECVTTTVPNDNHSFTNAAPALAEIYIPASFFATAFETKVHLGYVFAGGGDVKYFYTGTMEQAAQMVANFKASATNTNSNSNFLSAKIISWDEYSLNTDSYATGDYIICGYNVCDAFYNGVHKEDNNPCVINCSQCNTYNVAEKNPSHNESVLFTYANGYHNEGVKAVSCTNEGCKHAFTEEAKALFECCGYSMPVNNADSIAVGFVVNSGAIKEYEKATGKTVKYGAFAAAQNKIGNNDIFNGDGTTAPNTVVAEIEKYEYTSFDLVLSGFNDTNKNAMLAIGAYVTITDGENTEYSYMQPGKPAEGNKYSFISYNEIKDIKAD